MATVLVTGGTGTLGVPTVAALRRAGHTVRVLSRRGGAGAVSGDLVTGAGIARAMDGIDTVVHLATTNGKNDVPATTTLESACARSGVRHLVVMSIVGVDEIPLGYYRLKLEVESIAEQSSVAHTILRATQFHSLVEKVFTMQGVLPVRFAPSFSIQPIAVEDVAVRLTDIVGMDAAGRVPDIGGPEQRTAADLARAWSAAAGSTRPIWPLRLPGRTFSGFAGGHNLVPGPPYGTLTFEDYLQTRYPLAG
jgi:uncharacterized protein YbjT (DUF2867 family)